MVINSHSLLARPDIGNQFEVLLSTIYRSFVKSGDNVVDGGCNGGLHAIPLAHIVGRKGIVYAYEPQKKALDELKHWAVIDSVSDILVPRPVALSDSNRLVSFWINTADNGLSSIMEPLASEKADWVLETIQALRLDDEKLRQPVSFIKLDLEGWEYRALRGGREVIRQSKPIIVFENARQWAATRGGYKSHEFFDLFSSLGVVLYDFFGRPFSPPNWESADIPWYFVAVSSADKRLFRLLETIADFWSHLNPDSYLDDWAHVVSLISDMRR